MASGIMSRVVVSAMLGPGPLDDDDDLKRNLDELSLGLARAILLAASEMHELCVPPKRSACCPNKCANRQTRLRLRHLENQGTEQIITQFLSDQLLY